LVVDVAKSEEGRETMRQRSNEGEGRKGDRQLVGNGR